MEDDIDIEEHDLMDNPRIKSIFPDLSCVKIEVPDEEEFEDPYEQTPDEDEPQQSMMYQYEYSFETTDNTEEESMAYQEDNVYFYNNEIILGSKPPPDPDVLYEEALNSRPIVYLENWEYKLKSSPCYCETCETLFPTVNALDAHKMISHSYLIALDILQRNTARKSTVTSKYCNHCSKTFPDDTSLIKHLYELLPLNNYPKVEEKKEVAIQQQQYLCQKCKKIFNSHEDGKWHKKHKHPTLSHVHNLIIRIRPKAIKEATEVKIQPKKIKIEPSEIKIQPKKVKVEAMGPEESKMESKSEHPKVRRSREGKFFATSSLVPKNTLFQCNNCQIGFMSCFGASQHAKLCEKALPWQKCGICKRKIRSKEVKIHELQHSYSDKLKIYTVNKNLYDRVLCRCPKCSACLDEIGFWAHYQKCKKSDKKSIHCADCDIYLASARYASHRLKHSAKKLTKKDFIIVEFHDQKSINMVSEKKIEVMKKQRLKESEGRVKIEVTKRECERKVKSKKEITLYYCEICGCCQYISKGKGHGEEFCGQMPFKKYCDKCGLCFTSKSILTHSVLHEKKMFSLKDVKIVSLTSGAQIEPPMPDLLQCKTCEKHFLYRRSLRRHNCKTEKYITCKICTKKFNLQAFKVHKLYHSIDKLIPELMKKYNSITNMWNVIYMCSNCSLVTASYDAAVTHSQGHLNYIISDLHKNCDICDLRIAVKDFSSHKVLHENNESLKRQSFRILKYNHEDLFKNEWMLLFKPLPNEHKQQILSKSIYRYTRSVKMQVEVSGSTDETKYYCMNCKTYVDGFVIAHHLKSKCARNNKFVCEICREIFKTLKSYITHEGSHENEASRHTIVTFNNACDQEFNNHLSLVEKQSNTTVSSAASKSTLRELLQNTVKKTYKIYKCAKCLVCVNMKHSRERHNCVSSNFRRFCQICQQYFSSRGMPMHIKAHRKTPLVNKDTINVVYFNCDKAKTPPIVAKPQKSQLEPSANLAKIFKCKCGLHFTSMKTVQKHLDVCSPDSNESKEVCSKCNLVFSTDVLVTHLVNHHSKDVEIAIINVLKVNLIKCSNCLLFFTSELYFNEHTDDCDPKNGVECTECHLRFDKTCPGHQCSTNDTTCIFKITNSKKSSVVTTVFKCGRCDICYLQYKSFMYHLAEVNHKNKTTLVTCDDCGLRFTSYSFHKHEKIHSCKNEEYRIKVIDPVQGDSQTIVGYNRKNIDTDKQSPKKRKLDVSETESQNAKKAKTIIDTANLVPERKSKRLTESREKASTSKETIDFDDSKEKSIQNTFDESFNITQEDTNDNTISHSLKSRINIKKYDNKLFKCKYCSQHFLKYSTFNSHIKTYMNHDKVTPGYQCELCDLEFSKTSLPRHKYIHHEEMGLNQEDFVILYETAFTRETKLFEKIEAIIEKAKKTDNVDDSVEILEVSAEIDEIGENSTVTAEESSVKNQLISENTANENNSETKLLENVDSTLKEAKNDIEIDNPVEILNDSGEVHENVTETGEKSSVDSQKTSDSVASEINELQSKLKDSEKICYFKCSECNVCFINQKLCYDHTAKHDILDPKLYIQCKICNFQFLIDSLKEHMDLHHNSDFMIENLTIQEYKSMGHVLEPKIDVYLAVDKVQSRLVSTTTDVGVV